MRTEFNKYVHRIIDGEDQKRPADENHMLGVWSMKTVVR